MAKKPAQTDKPKASKPGETQPKASKPAVAKSKPKPKATPKAQAINARIDGLAQRIGLVIWRPVRWFAYLVVLFALITLLLTIVFRFANPYITPYYVAERARLGEVSRVWTPLSSFSPHVARAVVAAEDANFCSHFGFDFDAIRSAFDDTSRVRGGSTLSQQVAKNVFLWQGRTWLRKGLEAWFTLAIELTWSKARIVEVYLNIAEFDEGVFGAAAAGRHYFGTAPNRLTLKQAAQMAAVLPNPKKRSAAKPTAFLRKRANAIASGAQTIAVDGRADCFSVVEIAKNS